MDSAFPHRVGWIGTGRMGYQLAARLLDAGAEVWVWNRTRAKAEPLADKGAKVVDTPADLAECDIVFTMVAGPADVLAVTFGPDGVLSREDARPSILIDSTTIDPNTSRELTERAAAVGTAVLASPVSGNPKVVKSGKLTVVVSGPRDAYDTALPIHRDLRAQGDVCGRGRRGATGQDLSQPDARRRDAVHGRDHAARRSVRREALGLPGVSQRQCDGIHLHSL